MSERKISIIMKDVTGRMGRNQHLMNAIVDLRRDGVVPLADDTRLMPEPVLVGRDGERLAAIAKAARIDKWSTDLDAALGGRRVSDLRAANLQHAIAAGKHIYTEKPTAGKLPDALSL